MRSFRMPGVVEKYVLELDPSTVSITLFDRFEFVTSKYWLLNEKKEENHE